MFGKWFLAKRRHKLRKDKIPRHIAIIMDGNGRWARRRGLPRVAGHKAGMDAIQRCLEGMRSLDVRYLTLYAFSTENWRRPRTEVDFLMDLPKQFIGQELDTLTKNNIRLGVIGDLDGLPQHTREAICHGIEKTRDNDGLFLNFALNYGGRDDLVRAAQIIARQVAAGELSPDLIDKESLSAALYTRGIPDPDLVIRTSGEVRISNFMLWQIAYSELCFVDCFWPDFDEEHLLRAVETFQRRNRRFGGV
ncbi:MAG: isoprenyl transferase [Firmicutes bacterium]|nr:isoprenyl transferase [Bacillota bacterium]